MQVTEEDYRELDRYLRAVFVLLEGIADVDEAREILSSYLASSPPGLTDDYQELLIELFFGKCAKTYVAVQKGAIGEVNR